tara:strand:+ start:935 stop:1219 length:285 start_codon:yes stop_codon:yes gene_type:complete
MTINKKRHKDLSKLYEFKKYVFSFYGNHKDNLYLKDFRLTQNEINFYCDIYLDSFHLTHPEEYKKYGSIAFDSIDRERVRELIEGVHNDGKDKS